MSEERAKRVTSAKSWAPFLGFPCALGVTDVADISWRRNRLRPLIRRCMYTLPQAYSSTSAQIKKQDWAHRNWREYHSEIPIPPLPAPVRIRKPMVMGLSAIKGADTATMRKALQKSETFRDPAITEVAFWSLGPILATRRKSEVIRTASIKARAGLPQSHPDELADLADMLIR